MRNANARAFAIGLYNPFPVIISYFNKFQNKIITAEVNFTSDNNNNFFHIQVIVC